MQFDTAAMTGLFEDHPTPSMDDKADHQSRHRVDQSKRPG
jgi:hypothetical protein